MKNERLFPVARPRAWRAPLLAAVGLAAWGLCVGVQPRLSSAGAEFVAARVAYSASEPVATFVVVSTGDEVDTQPGDGWCRTSAGGCTLRAAIDEANAHEGVDAIHFAIGSGAREIKPKSALPVVFEGVTIDGASQPGFAGTPLITIDGSEVEPDDIGAGSTADGLVVVNGESEIRSLVVTGFGGAGLVLTEGAGTTVAGCRIGTDGSGTVDLGNRGDGIQIVNSSDNTIGGVEPDEANVISGNGGRGVFVRGVRSYSNRLQGNLIGVSKNADVELGNDQDGVLLADAPRNTIGGVQPGSGNVIGANGGDGVELSGGNASGNMIQGNFIGVGATRPLGNRANGVLASSAPSNTIGSAVAAGRNVISANHGHGVVLLGPDTHDNLVLGNIVGLGAAGRMTWPNDGDGVLVAEAPDNQIGGPDSGEGNVIAGNFGHGIEVGGTSARGNRLWGNVIGLNSHGESEGNSGSGVLLDGAPDVVVRGNRVSGNGGHGVAVSGVGSRGCSIMGNYIGLGFAASAPIGNRGHGVAVFGGSFNKIGDLDWRTGDPLGNVIAGNDGDGVHIAGPATVHTMVQYSIIGTDPEFAVSVANGGDGVAIQQGARHSVVQECRIGGNARHGISVVGSGTDYTRLESNEVGSSSVPNGSEDGGESGDGIHLRGGTMTTTIIDNEILGNLRHGINMAGVGNSVSEVAYNGIFDNQGAGILVAGGTRNHLSANRLASNGGLGIDLGDDGVTPNGSGLDANRGQNYPEWASGPGILNRVEGVLVGRPSSEYVLDFYVSEACDESGHGEGAEMWTERRVAAGADGVAEFALDLSWRVRAGSGKATHGSAPEDPASGGYLDLLPGRWLTATATDAPGNTSEFSACLLLVAPQVYVPYTSR